MTVNGKFNTDSQALARRINAHSAYGEREINPWILENLCLSEGLNVLDLGCGTGKQSLPIAKLVGARGSLTSVDLSRESLDILLQKAGELGLKNIQVQCMNLDDLNAQFKDSQYDRVVGSYSLYYAKDPRKLFQTIASLLKNNGILFYCGPSRGNNSELKEFHCAIADTKPKTTEAAEFMGDRTLVKSFFPRVRVFSFENPLRFTSADALYDYWRSYNLYDEKLDSSFQEAAKKHFQRNPFFETVKRVIGVQASK